MPHSVHKNQLEIDHIPKRKTYRKKRKKILMTLVKISYVHRKKHKP